MSSERVRALVAAAARVADATTESGRRARRELLQTTGLSAENIEWALRHALETAPADVELDALCASVEPANAVHVILPANVFVAAHRAIALGLAAARNVYVRPSRREPHFAHLLLAAAPGLFEIVSEITPAPGDHVWAYGGDVSLAAIRARVPAGATLHARGPGFGLAIVDATRVAPDSANALAADIAPFEQRGCLSPRAVWVLGDATAAHEFAALAADALTALATRIPLGRLDDAERADITRFRDAANYAGAVLAAGPGFVSVSGGASSALAPIGRNLCVHAAPNLEAALQSVDRDLITAIGVAGPSTLWHAITRALPHARVSELGRMQRPLFDGPADRRPAPPSLQLR